MRILENGKLTKKLGTFIGCVLLALGDIYVALIGSAAIVHAHALYLENHLTIRPILILSGIMLVGAGVLTISVVWFYQQIRGE
jgi:hypothetical protein